MLALDIQYWTSRGIAVVDVNYGGSTGYGRAYRERLRGNWGIVDTVDCINAARYLAERGDADPARIGRPRRQRRRLHHAQRAHAPSTSSPPAPAYFGLADLEVFATGGTHKFESRYLDGLVGPYPERRDVYRERSPIHHVDDIACPVILLQGLEDAIVPPAQAEIIVDALREEGPAATPTSPSRASSTASARPRTSSAPGGRAVLLRARVRLHAGRRDRAGEIENLD